ncbi:hypothetical protein EJ896_21225 [Klebsiella quasipneumoniae subsp. similipneumoniae]|uniref:DUF6945 domain-containing protein n=1 Tax=Klebsiella quasipneumoniae TaxID=1463165 RepID=UPI000F7F71EA|nr:hypothetical protein [Klebsiella quasipneumoniae]RTD69143.1 hypothetical protein EJ896_21225 [Klebsiella quasipneumoniae subsp. similipneumoniae]
MRVKKTKLPQTPPPDEPYTNIEMRLVCADSIRIRNTGEVITWKSDMFRVYLYMFNQIKGFEASGGKFFQKREKIWKCCGVSRDRLDKILKSLLRLGLIKDTGERRTAPGAPRGMVVYTAFRLMEVIGNLEIIFADDDGEPVWNHERASGKEATTTQTSSADEPADQSDGLASESAKPAVGQRDSVESDNDGSSDDRAAGNHAVSQRAQEFKDDAVFPSEKREPEETTGRVMASLDDLRCWSEVGSGEGMDDYGVMWGVEGIALYNLIDEHLETREEEAEKNFKLQRTH